jgi:hypothetical protein
VWAEQVRFGVRAPAAVVEWGWRIFGAGHEAEHPDEKVVLEEWVVR